MISMRQGQGAIIGIDTGGTFTDIVAVDAASGAMHVTKVASTPANPGLCALESEFQEVSEDKT